ncbi:unnamed protein product, partial [Urochloa humidicola]
LSFLPTHKSRRNSSSSLPCTRAPSPCSSFPPLARPLGSAASCRPRASDYRLCARVAKRAPYRRHRRHRASSPPPPGALLPGVERAPRPARDLDRHHLKEARRRGSNRSIGSAAAPPGGGVEKARRWTLQAVVELQASLELARSMDRAVAVRRSRRPRHHIFLASLARWSRQRAHGASEAGPARSGGGAATRQGTERLHQPLPPPAASLAVGLVAATMRRRGAGAAGLSRPFLHIIYLFLNSGGCGTQILPQVACKNILFYVPHLCISFSYIGW